MQKFGNTIITDSGMQLLDSVNGGDDKIQYTKTVLAGDDFTQTTDDAIKVVKDLQSIKQTVPTTVASRINDTINLSASFTNTKVTEDYDFYCIGWYAKGSAVLTDERLFAISPSTVKQTMPKSQNGAATASITPKYASALSRNAQVIINPEPAGSVTKEYVEQQVQALIDEGIINGGSILSDSDDLNLLITTSYHLDKGSLPKNAPDGYSKYGQVIVYGNKDTTDGVTQLAYDDINGASYVRSYNPTNNQWSTWDLIITKSQLNAVLPTDIARTGETNEFKAKNTFDVDPVNKDGNSYGLAKDIATKVTDNGDNSIEINKQAVTPVRDNKNGSINFNSKDMTPADDSAVVHTTGDETIDGQKKFKTDPTDSAGNAYAKTVDVNQQLDKKVNIADMRKPASDVAGIEEVNAKQDKISYTPADDSKVAHLSGANNFDTVPTVDHNPLLLARSLPSDLARTGSDQEFTGKNTFDTAPIDKKTGNPYITKDGVPAVPSTLADTTKPANFTAGLQSGGVNVATAADLKSVENSSWLTKSIPDSGGLTGINLIYKIHDDEKYIEMNMFATSKQSSNGADMLDMSSIVNKITKIDLAFFAVMGPLFNMNGDEKQEDASSSISGDYSGTKVILAYSGKIRNAGMPIFLASNGTINFAKIYYDSLV